MNSKEAPRDSLGYSHALDYLYSRINYEKTTDSPYDQQHFKLHRMQELLSRLGNPHLRAPVIHIAGTKGKGSVAWLLAETLRHSGLRVGLYTSPHLVRLEERFTVDGQPCLEQEVVEIVETLRPIANQLSSEEHGTPTFFELTTAMAWLLFGQRNTDVNVIEVGLGGRLDSTNVCQPLLSIITSISLDHQAQLGPTITSIAREKAGIIKPGIPVISGATHPEAVEVIRTVAGQQNAELWQLEKDFSSHWRLIERLPVDEPGVSMDEALSKQGTVSVRWHNRSIEALDENSNGAEYPMRMLGEHQSSNAALAIAAVRALRAKGWNIDEKALRTSLAQTQVTARMQIRKTRPWLILDSAHNMASMEALVQSLDQHFPETRRIAVFSASRDKDVAGMLRLLQRSFDQIILTQYRSNQRAVVVEQLVEMTQKANLAMHERNLAGAGIVQKESVARESSFFSVPLPTKALEVALENAKPEDLVVITGSFFLAAELIPNLS